MFILAKYFINSPIYFVYEYMQNGAYENKHLYGRIDLTVAMEDRGSPYMSRSYMHGHQLLAFWITLNIFGLCICILQLSDGACFMRGFCAPNMKTCRSFNTQLIYHYIDVTMSVMASQITSLKVIYSTVYSGANERKHQSSASLAFVWGIHRWPVNSPHNGPVTQKMFPFDDVIM